ncbi:Plasmid stabilization system protein ParE [Mycolicibacterium rutilum]|uniref:Plasmid stabilization system protein ParE n=1 Tax=Mycolicibacterium rutilum TaxID=370526 RepID=A0A1H6LY69_MYCRU|nr:type II toxin-antitoxin system RelE/ParE family toxin [Mycolicibacterium rutilum]SEH90023.1 Plasmid stabilization system protein ParE [Mycolicibacterium rutilum]
MSLSVVFTPEAQDHLVELYRYIADAASSEVAARFTDTIVTFCEDLAAFPHRGTARDDIRPGLRTVGFRRRVIIAFAVLDHAVVVIGVFYGGRDYEAILNNPDASE